MAKDIERMSLAELDALIEHAQEVRDATRARRKQELKAELEAKLKAEGFTPVEVLGAKIKAKPEHLPPRYADPDDRDHTWSGRGRVPGWLQAHLDTGKTLDEFLIYKTQQKKAHP